MCTRSSTFREGSVNIYIKLETRNFILDVVCFFDSQEDKKDDDVEKMRAGEKKT